jgi:uncharacterized membrane protein YidH (DUF202 family)
MDAETPQESSTLILNEVQLLLAEKRTSLSTLRTGIAVFALPLSVLSILVATSKFYELMHVWPLLIPILIITSALIVLGCFLIVQAIVRIRRYDNLIMQIKREHSVISKFID